MKNQLLFCFAFLLTSSHVFGTDCAKLLNAEAGAPSVLEKLKAFKFEGWKDADKWKRKKLMRNLLEEALATPSETAKNLRDWLKVLYLSLASVKRNTASLLFGSPGHLAVPRERALTLARNYKEKGFYIFYDADSPLAEEIQEIVGENGIGITSDPRRNSFDGPLVFSIANPYLRFRSFKMADRVVVSLDSVNGLGLLLHGDVTHVWDDTKTWKYWPAEWDWNVSPNLGLRYKHHPTIIDERLKVGAPQNTKDKWLGPYNEKYLIDDLVSDGLNTLIQYAIRLEEGKRALQNIPGGAVILGASEPHAQFTDLVYQSARALAELGIPIITGGSVGYMEVANAAAFDAGAHSIGIPHGVEEEKEGKGDDPKGEELTVTDRHSLTLYTQGYESRIPLLLHQRPMVIFVPGGTGTMKELGAAFIDWTSVQSRIDVMAFVGEDYYRGLFEGLQNPLLPEKFRKQFRLVKDAKSLREEGERVIERVGAASMITESRPVPRNEHRSFVARPRVEEKGD